MYKYCHLLGHRFVNEVQTMAQVFFAREKVNLVEADAFATTGTGVEVVTWVADAAHAAVYQDGVEVAAHAVALAAPDIVEADLPPRRVLMLAMFHALQAVFPTVTPWGALTGIRPSKMVRSWLDAGKTDAQIVTALTQTLRVRADKAQLALDVAKAEIRLTARIHAAVSSQPVGIYLGIPFCPSRCVYCSFNKAHRPPTRDALARYVDTLLHECAEKLIEVREKNAVVTSIYIGGGTPTVLPDDLLAKLLDAVGTAFSPARGCEYTVEAGRPDTLTPANLRILRQAGVNRLAVNPQTLNDHTLAAIGRKHTAADFFRGFSQARAAGFDCINADLIAHLPGEGADDLMRNIEKLGALSPENITVHTLSVKRASPLHDAPHTAANPEDATTPAALRLAEMGYAPYYLYRQKNTVGLAENIGFARPGRECLYNIGMMSEVQTVLGIGAGAVTKYVDGARITRRFNEKNPEIYVERRNSHASTQRHP